MTTTPDTYDEGQRHMIADWLVEEAAKRGELGGEAREDAARLITAANMITEGCHE